MNAFGSTLPPSAAAIYVPGDALARLETPGDPLGPTLGALTEAALAHGVALAIQLEGVGRAPMRWALGPQGPSELSPVCEGDLGIAGFLSWVRYGLGLGRTAISIDAALPADATFPVYDRLDALAAALATGERLPALGLGASPFGTVLTALEVDDLADTWLPPLYGVDPAQWLRMAVVRPTPEECAREAMAREAMAQAMSVLGYQIESLLGDADSVEVLRRAVGSAEPLSLLMELPELEPTAEALRAVLTMSGLELGWPRTKRAAQAALPLLRRSRLALRTRWDRTTESLWRLEAAPARQLIAA